METEYKEIVRNISEEAVKQPKKTVKLCFPKRYEENSMSYRNVEIPGFIAAKFYNDDFVQHYNLDRLESIVINKNDFDSLYALRKAVANR